VARIGILSVSDGRPSVHHDLEHYVLGIERELASVLLARGHEVNCGAHVLWTNELATAEARRMADWRPDLTIINISVWAFPHCSSLALYPATSEQMHSLAALQMQLLCPSTD
jgi:L-fucose/D-arabinose isomerase